MNAVVHASSGAQSVLASVVPEPAALAREYPLLFDASSQGGVATIEQDGAVRSACTFLMRTFVTPRATFELGLIGSVATQAEYRGRGLAGRVLAAAETELARRGALLAVLWADDPPFYERRGYAKFGTEIDFTLPADLVHELPAASNVRERRADDALAIDLLHRTHPERVQRSVAETAALLECPDMEVLVCERWGKIAAYTCLGRGRDLRDVIHEWAGDALTVLGLVRAHLERRRARGEDGDLYIIAPPSADDLAQRLEALGATMALGVLAMGKLLDARAAAELAASVLDRRKQLKVELGGVDTGSMVFVNGERRVSCTPEELVRLLFAARGDRTLALDVAQRLDVSSKALPLAPFAWGLDSI